MGTGPPGRSGPSQKARRARRSPRFQLATGLYADPFPARASAAFRPGATQDRLQRLQKQPGTTYRGPRGSPGPPTKAPQVAQDRPQRPHGSPKTIHRDPKSSPGPPTKAP